MERRKRKKEEKKRKKERKKKKERKNEGGGMAGRPPAGVDCLKNTEDKSLKSRIQTPDARLVIATSATLRCEG